VVPRRALHATPVPEADARTLRRDTDRGRSVGPGPVVRATARPLSRRAREGPPGLNGASESKSVWCPRNCGADLEGRAARLIDRCIRQAHFLVLETLQPFQFSAASRIPAATNGSLAEGRYFTAAEPVLLRGEPGTGKTILPSVSG